MKVGGKYNPETWVGDFCAKNDLSLTGLAIPGTHHSAVDRLCQMRMLGCYAVCQELSITEQLCAGVRFLNFNVADDYDSTTLYVSHNFASCELWPKVQEVVRFLDSHKGEVVALDFKKDYNRELSNSGLDYLVNGLVERLGRFGLINFANFKQPVRDHIAAGRRVCLSLFFEGRDFLDRSVGTLKSWAFTNSSDPTQVYMRNLSFMKQSLGMSDFPRFNGSEFVVTLDAGAIVRLNTIRSSTRALKEQLRATDVDLLKNLNVMLVDFFQEQDFQLVMRINESRIAKPK